MSLGNWGVDVSTWGAPGENLGGGEHPGRLKCLTQGSSIPLKETQSQQVRGVSRLQSAIVADREVSGRQNPAYRPARLSCGLLTRSGARIFMIQNHRGRNLGRSTSF